MTQVVSFLPSATEIVYALGCGDRLVGVSSACDHPAEARSRPVVVRSTLDLDGLSPAAIDDVVRRQLHSEGTLYVVDETQLRTLAPEVILAQDLCQVCAPSGNEITRVLRTLLPAPEVLWLTPHTLAEIEDDVRRVARRLDCEAAGDDVVARMRRRITSVQKCVAGRPKPRVLFVEWTDPVYCGGHWVPEMIAIAGGEDALGRAGAASVRVEWRDIEDWSPEVLIVSPCGYGVEEAARQARELLTRAEWASVPAVQRGAVFAVDANSYFARPGPRVAEGVELLAHLLHPAYASWNGPSDAWRRCP